MQPSAVNLLSKAGITIPLTGVYDAPDPAAFKPLLRPISGRHVCTFAYYHQWEKGNTLHLGKEHFGCGGCGRAFFGVMNQSREDFINFLVNDEGLKASPELMEQWIDHTGVYNGEHPHIMVGPLKEELYKYLKTVTFWVNPDQLGLLMYGAQYYSAPTDPAPVISPFGAGCMQMLTLFDDLEIPQAVIGTTDIAMRQHLPPHVLAFTVTRPMFERLCSLDEKSFLYKPFWEKLLEARQKNSDKTRINEKG